MEEFDPYVIADIVEFTGEEYPYYSGVSTRFRLASNILRERFIEKMNKEYPLWDTNMSKDIFELLANKALHRNDKIAMKEIMKTFINSPGKWPTIQLLMSRLFIDNRDMFEYLLPLFSEKNQEFLKSRKGILADYSPGLYRPIDKGNILSTRHLFMYNRNPVTLTLDSNSYLIYRYPNMWNDNIKDMDIGSDIIPAAVRLAKIMTLHDQGVNIPIPANIQ